MDSKKFLEVFSNLTEIYIQNEKEKENRHLLISLKLKIESILEDIV